MATGITRLHSKGCPAKTGDRCRCGAGYEASVYSRRDNKKIRKTFARESEAKSWRSEASSALANGSLRTPTRTTVAQAWDAWIAGARSGAITNRSGDTYKPAALRSYERAMRLRVLPDVGRVRLTELRRPDLQDLVDKLAAEGLNPSTVKCTLLPLRAVCRRAVARGELAVNPCDGVELAAVRGRRERIAPPEEAEKLVEAVGEADRVVWAAAMYAGLRRGELQALRAEDVDLAAGIIRVERGWDEKDGVIGLKSRAGRRRVPIAAVLRDPLLEHRMQMDREGGDLVFGKTTSTPFYAKGLQQRADTAWKNLNKREGAEAEEAGREPVPVERITLHECRHTFASLMIAAGVNAKALSTFMGHASIAITLDRYGHLMPGSEAEAAGLLDAYLSAQRSTAETTARSAGGAAGFARTEPKLK